MGTSGSIQKKNKKHHMRRIILHILILLSITQICVFLLTLHTYDTLEQIMGENNVKLNVDSDGNATYIEEKDVEGVRTIEVEKNKKYEIDKTYSKSISKIIGGELRYARNGFVYKDEFLGFGRYIIYDYGWVDTPMGENIYAKELLQQKKVKLYMIGMYATGTLVDVVVIYLLIIAFNLLFRKLYVWLMPKVVTRCIKKDTMEDEVVMRMEKSWEVLIKRRLDNSKEIVFVHILASIIFGLGGVLSTLNNFNRTYEFVSGYFFVYTLVVLVLVWEMYRENKKLEESL